MKTIQAYAGFFVTVVVYFTICVWCGVLAQSLSVFANSQTSFQFSSQADAAVVGTALYAREKNQEDFDEYWRCPGCGGLVNPELDACGCGFNR